MHAEKRRNTADTGVIRDRHPALAGSGTRTAEEGGE